MNAAAKLSYDVVSVRLSAHAVEARCKQATLTLDADVDGIPQAFNPVETP